MEHLAMLARMLLIEKDGYTELKDTAIQELIDSSQTETGIGDDTYEDKPSAKTVLKNLDTFHELFDDDPMLLDGGKIKELNREYFVLSFYMLIRHLNKHYALSNEVCAALREFFDDFHARWRADDPTDHDVVRFSENRQQDTASVRERDIILRHNFFEFIRRKEIKILAKDSQRAFNESQRIEIYRRDKGLCQECLVAGKPEAEARVPWSDYQADHIIAWIKGGQTIIENAQLLCSYHNQSKGSEEAVAV